MRLKVAVRSPQGEVRTLEFEKTAVSIGRGTKNDLVIQDATVSQSHATLIYNPRRRLYELADMGSTNGTFVDGRRIEASLPIDRPRVVLLGACQLLIYPPEEEKEKGTVVMDLRLARTMLKEAMIKTSMFTPDEADSLEVQSTHPSPARMPPPDTPPAGVKTRPSRRIVPESSSDPRVTLEFHGGQYAGESLNFQVPKEGLVFGRDVECQVVFKDPHISRRHFAIRAGEREFYLVNGRPANPILVDSRPVAGDSVRLHNGSEVECHEEGFVVRWEEEAAPAPISGPDSVPVEMGLEEKPLSQGIRKVMLRGDISIGDCSVLEKALLGNLGPSGKWALVDLTRVRTLDYPALASLIKVLAEYARIGGMIALIGVSPALISLFQLVRMDRSLSPFIFVDENEGLQALLRSRRG